MRHPRGRCSSPGVADDGAAGLVATAALAGDEPARPADSIIRGRVVDEGGKPVPAGPALSPGEPVDRRNAVIEETKSGPDGAFRLAARTAASAPARNRELNRLVLLADKPGLAVGWRIIPDEAKEFAEDIVLTPVAPPMRVAVTDAEGHPVAGASVSAYNIGDRESPSPHLRDYLSLRTGEPPLTAVTDSDGARHVCRPSSDEGELHREQAGLRRDLHLRRAETDPDNPRGHALGDRDRPGRQARRRHDGCPSRGVYVGAPPRQDRRAGSLSIRRPAGPRLGHVGMEADEGRQWRIQALDRGRPARGPRDPGHAGADVRGERRYPGRDGEHRRRDPDLGRLGHPHPRRARIWGLSTGGRLDGVTDAQGRVTFRTTRGKANVSIASPPPGIYIEGDLNREPAAKAFEVGEGEVVELKVPAGRRLIAVSGVCTRPDGSLAAGVAVQASSGKSRAGGRGGHTAVPIRPTIRADSTSTVWPRRRP